MALIKGEYPILEYDTAQEAITLQENGALPRFPKKAVFAFLLAETERYALAHGGRRIGEFESATKLYPIYACQHQGVEVCLCQAPVGAAAAVQILDYLISRGVTQVVSTGACGVLSDIPENQFLVPVSALRDEGVSYHYLPPSREIAVSAKGVQAVEKALLKAGLPFMEVKTWTTDGFYRETEEMVRYRRAEGCQAVEMECAGLAACAAFRGITWAMLLFSADTLADPSAYQARDWGKKSITPALTLALDAAVFMEDGLPLDG